MNQVVSAEEQWNKAKDLVYSIQDSYIQLAKTLYELRQQYPSNEAFGRERQKYLPELDTQSVVKLVKIGENFNKADLKILNQPNESNLKSLSLDALLAYSQAPEEVQKEVIEELKTKPKISAKIIREKSKPKEETLPPISRSGNPYEYYTSEELLGKLNIDTYDIRKFDWRIVEYAIKLRKQETHPDKGGSQEAFNDIVLIEQRLMRCLFKNNPYRSK